VPFLTRRRVCRLQLLLAFASAVILGSECRGTHDHILLSQILDFPNLEDQVPLFMSHRKRVAQLYPEALASLFVTYDPQGYGGGIRTRLHAGSQSESKLLYDWRFTANQFVLAPSPLRITTSDFFYWSSLYSPGMDHTENVSFIIACSLVAGETCPQSCSLATALVLSPVYTAVTCQWVYIPQVFSHIPGAISKSNLKQLCPPPPRVLTAIAWNSWPRL
jgi:hypothetical protein